MDIAEKIKTAYAKDKKKIAAIALVAIAGIVLRLSFINATDISGDEVFFATYAFKIASLLWQAPIIAIALAAISVIFVYLTAVKRNLWTVLLFAAGLLAARYVVGIPDLIPRVGPIYLLAASTMIYLTNLTPNIAGELVSTISMVLLAFVALYLGSMWNKPFGLLAFALVMLSPYNIFMSATSFVSPLGMFFLFSSIALFFKGTKDNKFLPGAGLLASLAYATRLPTIISFPVFIGLAFVKRKELLKKENRKNTAIFFTLTIATLLFMAPIYINQVQSVNEWLDTPEDNLRWDLIEPHMSSFVAQAADPIIPPNEDHFYIVNAMNLFYSPLFLLLLILAIPYTFWKAWKEKDLRLAALLFIGIGIFLSFFISLSPYQRINRGLGYEFPFLMLVSFMLCSGKRFVRARKILGLSLVLVFLFNSISVIQMHNFRGISEFADSVPEESLVFCQNTCYQMSYYRGIYKYDLSIRKPLFDKIFKPNPEIEALFQKKTKSLTSSIDELPNVDYALVRPEHFKEEIEEMLQNFKRCESIKNGEHSMLLVFAKERCP